MFTSDNYELIDFGAGRRLERFAGWVIDRPCPAAEQFRKTLPERWDDVDARFEREEKGGSGDGWTLYSDMPEVWTIRHDQFEMELRRSPVGHLGVFPEQASNWDWIAKQIAAASKKGLKETVKGDRHLLQAKGASPLLPSPAPLKILNLFAYTGGSTLAAAAAGMNVGIDVEVVHVDSAANTVSRAKRNAEISNLSNAPIRWITEDAAKFVRRELKRGNHYNAVILDPPSYGHGRRGEVWQVAQHLPELLALCAELTADRRLFLLLTCHTPGFDEKRLAKMLREAVADPTAQIAASPLGIKASSGQMLPAGVFVRMT